MATPINTQTRKVPTRPIYILAANSNFSSCHKGPKKFIETITSMYDIPEVNIRTCTWRRDFITHSKWLMGHFSTKECTVITYFAGHGDRILDTSGDEEDGYDEYYIFNEGILLDDQLTILLLDTKPFSPNNLVVTVSDCCSSGSALDESIPDDYYKHTLHKQWLSLGATTDTEDAFVDGDGPVFTQILCEILPQIATKLARDWQQILLDTQMKSWLGILQHFTVKMGSSVVNDMRVL